MSEQRHHAEELVAAMQLADAAKASIRRCGTQEQEVQRRASVRALVRSSRALARVLGRFADCAGPHADGVHSFSRMDAEVAALNEALGDFVFAAQQAAQCDARTAPATDREVSVPGSPDEALSALHANWLPLRWPKANSSLDGIDALAAIIDQTHGEESAPPS